LLLWGIQDVDLYTRQGLLTELPVDEIKKNIPNLAKLIDSSDAGAWINGMIAGKNYGIPITNLDGRYPYFPLYNDKWLKAIGYNQPPKTLVELEDVLYKFRNNDPDGNGKKDTYGLGGKGKSNQALSFPAVFGAFNVQPFSWKLSKEGNMAYGMTTPEARQAFRLINKWFKDGVLDPEFITSDGNKEEFGNGLVGMGYESWNHIRPSGKVAQLAAKKGFDLAIGGALNGPDGSGSLLAFGLTSNYLGMGADVAKNPEKKKKIYEILNSFYSDRESILYSQFGEENVHYTVQNGKPTQKQEYVAREAQLKLGLGNYYGLLARKTTEFETFLYPDSDLQFRENISKNVKMMIDPVKFNIPSLANFPELSNMEKEYFIKFITGEVNLDEGFDSFVDKWMKAGGKTVTEEVNKLYKEYNKK
jgi:putative aldouronate transport system substrate-binding protein